MDSLGCFVLEENLEQLKTSGVDPFRPAWELRLAKVITDADLEKARNKSQPAGERWGTLVSAIKQNRSEGVFQTFIEALLSKKLEELGRKMKDAYLLRGGVWKKDPEQASGGAPYGRKWKRPPLQTRERKLVGELEQKWRQQAAGQGAKGGNGIRKFQLTTDVPDDERLQKRSPEHGKDIVNEHFSSQNGEMAVSYVPRSHGPVKVYSPSVKIQGRSTSNHPEQKEQDPGGDVKNVNLTVTSWNNSPDTLQHKEKFNYPAEIKQSVSQVSLDPQKWPTAYLSQPVQNEGMAVSYVPRNHGPMKVYSPSMKSQGQSTSSHPDQEEQDPGGDVKNVIFTVTSWNNSPGTLQPKERLNYLAEIKQNVSQMSLDPQKWPMAYLSQPALLTFLRLVVDHCTQQSSLEGVKTAEIRVAVKKVVEPIDLDLVEDLPFRKHISKWAYGTEKLPLVIDCENMLSLQKYFQYALDRMEDGPMNCDPLGVMQPDVKASVASALAKVVCFFTNHLRKTGQVYEEAFVVTMLLPFKYDPDKHAFLTSIPVRDVKYLCNKFGHLCKEFFEVLKQNNVRKSQAYLLLLALKMHNELGMPDSLIRSCLQYIQQRIGENTDSRIAEILLQQDSHNYRWLQSQLESVSSHEEIKCHSSASSKCEELFSVLGLSDFYPQKLTLHHALEIREDTLECVKHLLDTGSSSADKKPLKRAHRPAPCTDPRLYPFLILQKIMAFDCTCRTKLVLSSQACGYQGTLIKALSANKRAKKNVSEYVVHPMDGLLAVLHCADNFLRQDLISRLATCQLAVPLLLPDPFEPDKVTFPLWALRSIVREWQLPNGTTKEGQLACTPSPLVCFFRVGEFKRSKSYIMNIIISESKHDTFFQYNCDGGYAKRLLVNGLVEMCWYLPSKRDSTFSDLVAFANLHGDAQKHRKQVNFLSKVSFMNFVFINEEDITDEALIVLKTLATAPGGLILLLVDSSDDDDIWDERLEPIKQSVQIINLEDKDEATYCDEIHEEINSKIDERSNAESNFSLEKSSDAARLCSIHVDEDEEPCMKGRELATAFEMIICEFRKKHRTRSQGRAESFKNLLPLQGPDLWHEWARTEKEQFRQTQRSQHEVEVYSQQQRKKMRSIREKQVSYTQSLEPLMKSFLNSLLNCQGKTRHYCLQWIRFFLDYLARDQLPGLRNQYRHKNLQLQNIQSNNVAEQTKCKAEKQKLNKQITDASFGLEHLLREVSQTYEAVAAQRKVPDRDTHFLRLPEAAAEMMIEGYPLELMDGDAAHVPISWVSAVLSKVQELLKNPRVFVLSVLGIQSSGKSTLLNTVFGVRFSVSVGRCTRGAFMQLLPIHQSLQHECKCDYFLIIDTEGLRAPQQAQQTLKHDNELATFVIGLANLTIINLSGETGGDMENILQTSVHAFLRMKTVRLKPSCHFVHQNVTAVQAREKAMMDHMTFKETLDEMTQAAAEQEGQEDKYKRFTDVIDFDSEKHVFYFQNLWKGDPPMAPVNPGYSTNAQCLKLCLTTHAKEAYSTDFNVFQKHLKDLWQAILQENFVFSFKNILEVTAYNKLDGAYSNWSWQFKEKMMTWEQGVHHKIKGCEVSELPSVYHRCIAELPGHVHGIYEKLKKEMELFFKNSAQHEIIVKWEGEIEVRLESLKKQLKQQAEDHCKYWKTNREALATVDSMKLTHRGVILDQVKKIASQLEKGTLNDQELEERFNEVWVECIKHIESVRVQMHTVDVYVRGDVEKCLIEFEPLRPSQPLVIKKLSKTHLSTGYNSLHLHVRNEHVKERPVYRLKYIPMGTEHPVAEGQKITNKLLERQGVILQQMKKQDYNPNLATELLRKLFDGISKNSTDVNFTEEYRVDIALAVCQYATVMFDKMVKTEKKRNDPVAYLKREVRGPFLKIFKDEYYQIAREVTAASAICDLLQHSVKEAIMSTMSRKIASRMRGIYGAFLQTKPALKAKILEDIGEKLDKRSEGHLEDCILYLTNIEKSLHCWLERYTLNYCAEGQNFAEIATTDVSDYVNLLTNLVEEVSKAFLQKGEFRITEWLIMFHAKIQNTRKLHLDKRELCLLGGVHQLKDVSRFKKEIMKGLTEFNHMLQEEFQIMPLGVMDNWKEKPHDHLFESLAGCTEQCPFCKEQCHNTNSHSSSIQHAIAMHRPQCLGRYHYIGTKKMVLDICTTSVAGDGTFRNVDTEWKDYPYKEYTKFYPQWHIPADTSLEESLYWKWLLGQFADKLAQEFGMEETDISDEWKELQWSEVKKDLMKKYNL